MNCKYCNAEIDMENDANLCMPHLMYLADISVAYDKVIEALNNNAHVGDNVQQKLMVAKNTLTDAMYIIDPDGVILKNKRR